MSRARLNGAVLRGYRYRVPSATCPKSVGLALATERIPFATAIAPICAQSVDEFAQNAAYLHEVSGGRFQFGIGVAHARPMSAWRSSRASHWATFVPLSKSSSRTPHTVRCHR